MSIQFFVKLKDNFEDNIRTNSPELYRYVSIIKENFDIDGIFPVLGINPTKVTIRRDNYIEQTETTLFLLPDKTNNFHWIPYEYFSFVETFTK